jgi:hypothetical protein
MEIHTIIALVIFCIVVPFLIGFVWKLAQDKIQNAPLKLRHKRLKYLVCGDTLLILLIPILGFILLGDLSGAIELSKKVFSNIGLVILLMIPYAMLINDYFRKNKVAEEKEDEQN